MVVTLLRRLAEAQGGFGAVLTRGDAAAGTIVVLLTERGRRANLLERSLDVSGAYEWRDSSGQALHNDEEWQKFLDRKQRFDPDMWLIELDVPSAERFTAEMNESV
ncbi:MAG TPA: DUF1491 family protein [Allosphingosinicella sp.]